MNFPITISEGTPAITLVLKTTPFPPPPRKRNEPLTHPTAHPAYSKRHVCNWTVKQFPANGLGTEIMASSHALGTFFMPRHLITPLLSRGVHRELPHPFLLLQLYFLVTPSSFSCQLYTTCTPPQPLDVKCWKGGRSSFLTL